MQGKELIEKVAQDVGMSRVDVAKVVRAALTTIANSALEGEVVKMKGIGRFRALKDRESGARVVVFKPSPEDAEVG